MNYNQKRSKLLKASTVYIAAGQGKNHIEQFARSGSFRVRQDGVAAAADLLTEDADEERCSFRRGLGQAPAFLPVVGGSRYPLELSGGLSDRKLGANDRVDSVTELSSVQVAKQEVKDEVPVEILGGPEAEGVRPDPDDEATECSSSFGYTGSSSSEHKESDNFEVESALRDGDGAVQMESKVEENVARKRALNPNWKNYRRGIEWRCRWLDLRLAELKRQAARYDRVYSSLQQTKGLLANSQQSGPGAARACPLPEGHRSQPVLPRCKRKKVEETADIAAYMSRHPLFSRYERKKRDPESLPEGKQQQEAVTAIESARLKCEEPETEEAEPAEPNSLEQVLWTMETLQLRVSKLKSQLKASQAQQRASTSQPAKGTGRGQALKSAQRSRPSSAGVSSVPTPKGVRRRAADFDINNIVMPVSVGAKHVEHIRHANIETPQWRLVEKPSTTDMDVDDSSEEDTDDETYRSRHAPLEMRERQNRYVPQSSRRHNNGGDSSVAASKSKSHGYAELCTWARRRRQDARWSVHRDTGKEDPGTNQVSRSEGPSTRLQSVTWSALL